MTLLQRLKRSLTPTRTWECEFDVYDPSRESMHHLEATVSTPDTYIKEEIPSQLETFVKENIDKDASLETWKIERVQ